MQEKKEAEEKRLAEEKEETKEKEAEAERKKQADTSGSKRKAEEAGLDRREEGGEEPGNRNKLAIQIELEKMTSKIAESLGMAERLKGIEAALTSSRTLEKEVARALEDARNEEKRKKKKRKRKEKESKKETKRDAKKADKKAKKAKQKEQAASQQKMINDLHAARPASRERNEQAASQQAVVLPAAIVPANHLTLKADKWRIADVQSWLEHEELAQYRTVFLQNNVDGGMLLALRDDQLFKMVPNELHSTKFRRLISTL